MKFRNVKRKEKFSIVKAGLTGVAIALAAYFGNKLFNDYKKYGCAPVIEHKVNSGENLTDYYKTENTAKDVNLNRYVDTVMNLNSDYINGMERIISNPDRLISGRVIYLPDVNRDGYVGKR